MKKIIRMLYFPILYDKGLCLKTEYEKDATNCKRVRNHRYDHL